jgi:RNA polymerase sigma-54 factor
MKLDFNLQVAQRQGLTLTAQVQQAIKLLHMTNMEIQEFVTDQFQDNPFIETNAQTEENLTVASHASDNKDLDKSLSDNPYNEAAKSNNLTQENQFETGESYIPKSTVSKAALDFDTISLVAEESKSLYAHCLDFINSLRLSHQDFIIAQRILEELEPTGWLTGDLDEIAKELNCKTDHVEEILTKLQDIEPAGLFARSLKECLVLQAKDSETHCKSMAIVLENLHLMASGKFDLLKRRSGCSDEEIALVFKKIKSFDPKPGLKFEHLGAPIREPDLRVYEQEDGWSIELNNSTLPDVKIEKEYAQDLRNRVKDKNDRDFIRDKVTEAKWLAKAIEKRNETMLKVGSEIIKRQTAFLEKGAQFIQPMVLKDIADAVAMHESTISRVTTGSLIQTPRGTMELKAFFSVGIQQEGQNETTSATSIKFKIKKLIAQEDPSVPISDDLIVSTLAKEGISVARRTVAKYRKLDNIPSSFARKRRNVLSGAFA